MSSVSSVTSRSRSWADQYVQSCSIARFDTLASFSSRRRRACNHADSAVRRTLMTPRHARTPSENDDSETGAMGFLEHLDELRKRLIRSCIAIGVGMAISAVFIDRIAN